MPTHSAVVPHSKLHTPAAALKIMLEADHPSYSFQTRNASSRAVRLVSGLPEWRAAAAPVVSARFRTIQICPKDLARLSRHNRRERPAVGSIHDSGSSRNHQKSRHAPGGFLCPISGAGKFFLHSSLERTRVSLGLADDLANGIIAKRIIELAKTGERNPDLLCEGALKKLRDHLYSD